MKTHKRAIRRRNNARLIQLRYKQEFNQRHSSHDDNLAERQYWALLRARHRLDCSKMCNCGMCRNPRYNGGWPADGVLTMQERVVNDIQSYGLEEYFSPDEIIVDNDESLL